MRPRSLRSALLLHFCAFWKCFKAIRLHHSFGTKTGNNQPTPLERKGISRTYLNTHFSNRHTIPSFKESTNGCAQNCMYSWKGEVTAESQEQTADQGYRKVVLPLRVPPCPTQLHHEYNPTHELCGRSSFTPTTLLLPSSTRTPRTALHSRKNRNTCHFIHTQSPACDFSVTLRYSLPVILV